MASTSFSPPFMCMLAHIHLYPLHGQVHICAKLHTNANNQTVRNVTTMVYTWREEGEHTDEPGTDKERESYDSQDTHLPPIHFHLLILWTRITSVKLIPICVLKQVNVYNSLYNYCSHSHCSPIYQQCYILSQKAVGKRQDLLVKSTGKTFRETAWRNCAIV